MSSQLTAPPNTILASEAAAQSGSILAGLTISALAALGIGVAGGAFEAIFLVETFQFVTFTIGPDVVFLLVNACLLGVAERPRTKTGLTIGFLAVFLTALSSFFVFLFIVLQNLP